MRRALAVLALLVLLLSAAGAGAQGISLSIQGRYVSGGITLGGYGPVAYGPGYYRPGLSYGPVPIYGGYYAPRASSITIYTPVQPRPTVIMPPPAQPMDVPVNNGADLRDEDFPDKIIIRPGQRAVRGGVREGPPPVPVEPEPVMPPGEPAGNFRPIRPEDRERVKPAPDDRPLPADAAPGFGPFPGLGGEKPAPGMPADRPVPADPKQPAHEQFMSLGKQAFADQEYGRAAQRFRQALDLAPEHSPAWFLLAQAQFALGKYREAVATIHTGLRLNPVWPNSRFKAREAFGEQADVYPAHLALLEAALKRHPDDPSLLFLYAYQLWFSGKQDEARPYFQRALPLVAEPRFIQMFLQAHNGPVVAR